MIKPRVEIINTHPPLNAGGSRADQYTIRKVQVKLPVTYQRSGLEGFHVKHEPPNG